MAQYVDGFVLAVPKKNIDEYKKAAKFMAKLSKKYGALAYMECRGEDMAPDMGGMGMKALQFPKLMKTKPGEDVWFSFIVYKSRKHRDQVNAKIMKDPTMGPENWKDKPMPFDMKRMAYGGFTVEVAA